MFLGMCVSQVPAYKLILSRGEEPTIREHRVRRVGVGEQAGRRVSAEHGNRAVGLVEDVDPFLVGVHDQVAGARGRGRREVLVLGDGVARRVERVHPDGVAIKVGRVQLRIVGAEVGTVDGGLGGEGRLGDDFLQRARVVDRDGQGGAVDAPRRGPDRVGRGAGGADVAREGVDALGREGDVALVRQAQVLGDGVALERVRGQDV